MATSAYSVDKTQVVNELRRQSRLRNPGRPDGSFVYKVSKSFVGASFDVVGDMIQLCQFPDKFRLLGVSVVSDKEYDTGGTAARLDLVLDDSVGTASTSAVGGAFGNQPANDGLEIVSSDAADITQSVTIYGTTTSTDTVVVETIALDAANGTTAVSTVKTDWGQILAVTLSASCAGTITVREASGNATVTTLTTGVLSKGVNTITSTSYYNRLVNIVASGSSTKQIGLKGTDEDGNVIYDSQAISGTTEVQSNSSFTTITELYTGDLESNRTVTITPSEQQLVAASAAFNQTPILPINFASGAISGSEFGLDVSEDILALRVNIAPTTGNSGTVTLTATIHGYYSDTPLVTLS